MILIFLIIMKHLAEPVVNSLYSYIFKYRKKTLELIKKIELTWCIDETSICAPESRVKIPSKICKINNIPIIFIILKYSVS